MPMIGMVSGGIENIEETLNRVQNLLGEGRQLQLLIVILPERGDSYGIIKEACDIRLGFMSQCCKPENIVNYNTELLENLAMKINAKVGGRNYALSEFAIQRVSYVAKRPTIIFGADVSHPSPGDHRSPSIAAVSCNAFCFYI
ncbi:putative Piwi domain, ribonuclease H-like superfamily [Helianthus debilis subsp. tardiflorus]